MPFPVFVVGSPRSGTSLVYSLLLASGDFAIYEAETHLIRNCSFRYGNLQIRQNAHVFLKDWFRSKQFKRSFLSEAEFLEVFRKHNGNYHQLLYGFMKKIAEKQKKERWAENTPDHIFDIKEIKQNIPNAKFIHIIRDGRAVAASLNKIGWVAFQNKALSLISAGLQWRRSVLTGHTLGKELNKCYMEIKYEDLIKFPNETLQKIGAFTQVDLDLNSISKNKVGVLSRSNTAFINESKQNTLFHPDAISRWEKILTDKERNLLEAIIGDTLKQFGYNVQSQDTTYFRIVGYFLNSLIIWRQTLKNYALLRRFVHSGLEFI